MANRKKERKTVADMLRLRNRDFSGKSSLLRVLNGDLDEDYDPFAEPTLEQTIQTAKVAMGRMARLGGTIEQAQEIVREAFAQ